MSEAALLEIKSGAEQPPAEPNWTVTSTTPAQELLAKKAVAPDLFEVRRREFFEL
jgi:hypothetical protein